MNDHHKIINKKYYCLYKDYYDENVWFDRKRKLSAIDSAKNIKAVLKNSSNLSLLDVGAGDGNVLDELSKSEIFKKMSALEISDSGIEKIKSKNISKLKEIGKFDGYRIGYKNKEFDLVIAIHVLEHVEHERLFLAELGRVSKKIHIEVPLEHVFNIRRTISNGKNTGHINFYTIETLVDLLESSGFKIINSSIFSPSVEYEQHLYGKNKGRIKNIIRKLLLKIVPNFIPKFLTYNGYVYCECPENVLDNNVSP
jgi:ubiquinone/menaquinone biosynthesis C-methylase UbiE